MAGKSQGEPSKGPRQSTLMGYFGKPKAGPVSQSRPSPSGGPSSKVTATKSTATQPSATVTQPPAATSSPTSTTLRTPSSNFGSSPHPTVIRNRVRSTSPLKNEIRRGELDDDDDGSEELTPPPLDVKRKSGGAVKRADSVDGEGDVSMENGNGIEVNVQNDSPVVLSRRVKRRVIYAESDSDDDEDMNGRSKPAPKRKSLHHESDDDEFEFNSDDDGAMAAAADEYEASAISATPPPSSSPKFKKPKSSSFKPPAQKSRPSVPASRPPPRPLSSARDASGSGWDPRRSSSRGGSDSFMKTEAELRKIEDKEKQQENEQMFSFLEDVRDKNKHRPDHPDYDKRSIHIPPSAFNEMTPFEKQFWDIKQNHYDTVLFFQKGKFYELYEDDAMIGHQEFDLKLTNRVKMKMVGVPEQSFEYWAAKFLAAGHKVGKVEQKETAIGKEMRTKKSGPGKPPDKIVNRELAQVFTNGTIVDSTYLTSDDPNHCVAIKESIDPLTGLSNYGICILDASTGVFDMAYLEDDVVHTKLETLFRQIRPRELLHAAGNLSVPTQRLLRNILPSSTLWESFRDGDQFYSCTETLRLLEETYQTASDPDNSGKMTIPETIQKLIDVPLAIEALGGMMFYIKTMNLDKDLLTQRNFNIYDPISEGKSMVLDGQTLSHMEVLVNNEGGEEGTLYELLQLCQTPFGKRLFRHWLLSPLRDAKMINERLDAVDSLLENPDFTGKFRSDVKGIPDLERLVSRIHAGSVRQSIFDNVVMTYDKLARTITQLTSMADQFSCKAIYGLLRTAPDLKQYVSRIQGMYSVKRDSTLEILPLDGADELCDEWKEEVRKIESQLGDVLEKFRKQLGLARSEISFWDSAQGGKDIYQVQVPEGTDVPHTWTKHSGTKKVTRYQTPITQPLIRQLQEAREEQNNAKQGFFSRLLQEFDRDRSQWLAALKVVAELDCLISLAMASHNLDEPKCRPKFIDSPTASIDFKDLRHPSMCLRSDFISNDVQLGGEQPRMTLLTGPNMAGKSTLLRMTAAGLIMAQMGCYVPASEATLSPVDKIQTRMGAYDNMFASSSTFKVELDECSKILREAGPRSFVILDELGRGTSTYDGMAIAGAVLHHLATQTLPLGFFATHYGALTDDYTYHPNVRKMHMQTHVDDEQRQVVFLYKLIPGVAESSHGTHVAQMAGVPQDVVSRADQVSAEFFEAFKEKMSTRRQSALPLVAQSDFKWLMGLVKGVGGGTGGGALKGSGGEPMEGGTPVGTRGMALDLIRRAIGRYGLAQ